MSVMADASIEMKMKQTVPEKVLSLVKEDIGEITVSDLNYCADVGGNWRLDDIIAALEVLNPYIEAGSISYWSDEGDARVEFCDGVWREEWEERYYHSELPNSELSETNRVKEILTIIAKDLMASYRTATLIDLLLNKCKLTDKEIELYDFSWIKSWPHVK